jgi:hypothetical protein
MPSIEARIRFTLAMKVKVKITKRRRSKGGFYVWFQTKDGKQGNATARTRKEALAILLANVRCWEPPWFEISMRPPHRGD